MGAVVGEGAQAQDPGAHWCPHSPRTDLLEVGLWGMIGSRISGEQRMGVVVEAGSRCPVRRLIEMSPPGPQGSQSL